MPQYSLPDIPSPDSGLKAIPSETVFRPVNHLMKLFYCLPDSAYLVNQPFFHRLLSYQHRSQILGQHLCIVHQILQLVIGDVGMALHKGQDPILYHIEILIVPGISDNHSAHAHSMNHHSSCGNNKRIIRRHRQGHTDGVAAAKHQRNRRHT